jgi:hypothetical protein
MTQRDVYLDAGMRGWIVNFANANHWRVKDWYELDDLIQDGYLCYAKVRNHRNYVSLTIKKHPSDDDRRNFMALVKVAFENHVKTLAANHSLQRVEHTISQMGYSEDESTEATLERHLPADTGLGNLAILLKKAPDELTAVVNALINDSTRFMRYRVPGCSRLIRETNAQRAWRVLGSVFPVDKLLGEVRDYFA